MEDTKVVLRNVAADGTPLEVTFLPEKGMNMVSYKRGDIEVIDQGTRTLFEERFAGLGALIGPHFHRRKVFPPVTNESLFPHIARVKAKGVQDPFSHGIARYAPWKAEFTDTQIDARLSGDDLLEGIKLAALEGQNFKMHFQGDLTPRGLKVDLSIVSETDSLVGLHYYYALHGQNGIVRSRVQNKIIDQGEVKKPSWDVNEQNEMLIPIGDKDLDCTFYPFPHPREGKIYLECERYCLEKRYQCISQENSWQLYHPQNASFVCIEPISSKDPRHPNLTVSSLQIEIEIFPLKYS